MGGNESFSFPPDTLSGEYDLSLDCLDTYGDQLPSSQVVLRQTKDLTRHPLWKCSEEIASRYQVNVGNPYLTEAEFYLKKGTNPLFNRFDALNLPSGLHSVNPLRKETTDKKESIAVMTNTAKDPVDVRSIDAEITIQLDPVVIYFSRPYLPDMTVTINPGLLSIPAKIYNNHLILDTESFLQTEGGSIHVQIGDPSAWILPNATLDLPLIGAFINEGHPTYMAKVPEVYSSPFFLFPFYWLFNQLHQEVWDLFAIGDYSWCDDSFLYYKQTNLAQNQSLLPFLDENGKLKQTIPLDEIPWYQLKKLTGKVRRIYNEKQIFKREAAPAVIPDKSWGEKAKEWIVKKFKEIFIGKVSVDTTIHAEGLVELDTDFEIPDLNVHVQIREAKIFGDWRGDESYEVRGQIPLTDVKFKLDPNQDFMTASGQLDFRFNTHTKIAQVRLDITHLNGFEYAQRGSVQLEVALPLWRSNDLDFKTMVEEITTKALIEWNQENRVSDLMVEASIPHWSDPISFTLSGHHQDPSGFSGVVHKIGLEGISTYFSDWFGNECDADSTTTVTTRPFKVDARSSSKSFRSRMINSEVSYDHYEGEFSRVNLDGALALYDGPRIQSDSLLVSLDEFHIKTRPKILKPDHLVGSYEVDIGGIKIQEDNLKKIAANAREAILSWLGRGNLKVKGELNWKPRLLGNIQISQLPSGNDLNIAELEDIAEIPEPESEFKDADTSDVLRGISKLIFSAEHFYVTPFSHTGQYDRRYYKKWADKSEFCMDLARNRFINRTQKEMRRHEEGMLLNEGKKLTTKYWNGLIHIALKEDTRVKPIYVHELKNPEDEFSVNTGIDLIFSRPVTVKALGFIPIACINGFYRDVEDGMMVPLVDFSPWPDNWSEKLLTDWLWEKTPKPLRDKLTERSGKEGYPIDMGIWHAVLSDPEIVNDLLGEIKTAPPLEDPLSSNPLITLPPTPSPQGRRELNFRDLFSTENLPPIHFDVKVDADKTIDFGFAKVSFECLKDQCPFGGKHKGKNVNRMLGNYDHAKKELTLDFPFVERLVVSAGDQALVFANGSVEGLQFIYDEEKKQFRLNTDSLAIQAIQFLDFSEEGPSYVLNSSKNNRVFDVRGVLQLNEAGHGSLDIDMGFEAKEDVAIHIRHKEEEPNTGKTRLMEHYVDIKDIGHGRGDWADRNKIQGNLYSSMELTGNGMASSDLNLRDWNVELWIPHAHVTTGVTQYPSAQTLRQWSERATHVGEHADHPDSFEIGFDFTNGYFRIGYEYGSRYPNAAFVGNLDIHLETPITTTQRLMPGIDLQVNTENIRTRFSGTMELAGDTVTLQSLDLTKEYNADNPLFGAPITFDLRGNGRLLANSTSMTNDEGKLVIPEGYPQFRSDIYLGTTQVQEAKAKKLVLIIAEDKKNPGEFRPQLKEFVIDSLKFTFGNQSEPPSSTGQWTTQVYQVDQNFSSVMEWANNQWKGTSGYVSISDLSIKLLAREKQGEERYAQAGGIIDFDLRDQTSTNYLQGHMNFADPQGDPPHLQAALHDEGGDGNNSRLKWSLE